MPFVLGLIGAGIGFILGMFAAEADRQGDYDFAMLIYAPSGGLVGCLIGVAIGTWAF